MVRLPFIAAALALLVALTLAASGAAEAAKKPRAAKACSAIKKPKPRARCARIAGRRAGTLTRGSVGLGAGRGFAPATAMLPVPGAAEPPPSAPAPPGEPADPTTAPQPTPVPTPPPILGTGRAVSVRGYEFGFTLSRAKVVAGEVRVEFNLLTAEDPHSLVITRADGTGPEYRFFSQDAETVTSKKFDLTPGTWTLVCDLDGHEAKGMKAALIAE